jgi:hypothetical protein
MLALGVGLLLTAAGAAALPAVCTNPAFVPSLPENAVLQQVQVGRLPRGCRAGHRRTAVLARQYSAVPLLCVQPVRKGGLRGVAVAVSCN